MKFDSYREKVLRHVAIVAKFLDDKSHLKVYYLMIIISRDRIIKTISKASLNSLNVLECKYDDFVVCIERPGMKFRTTFHDLD